MQYWKIVSGKVVIGEESEGGGWFVKLVGFDYCQLFEVPVGGGEPQSVEYFQSVNEAVKFAKEKLR